MRKILDREIESFHRDGALLLKSVLDDHWLERLEHCLALSFASPDAKTAGMGDALRIDHFPADKIPSLRKFIGESPLAECVGRILNGPVRFYMDQVF